MFVGIGQHRQFLASLVVSFAAILVPGVTSALGQTVVTIADTQTVVPGTNATFAEFTDARELSVHGAVFHALDSDGGQGLYLHHQNLLEVIADTSTIVPGMSARFERFYDVSFAGDDVVFTATWSRDEGVSQGLEGVFLFDRKSGEIESVLVSESASVRRFHGVEAGAGIIVLSGGSQRLTSSHGDSESLLVSRRPGHVRELYARGEPRPGGGEFNGFNDNISVRQGQLLFVDARFDDYHPAAGIYTLRSDSKALQVVADSNTRAPRDRGGLFETFGTCDWDGNDVYFTGNPGHSRFGLYAGTSPVDLRALVLPFRAFVPGTDRKFTNLDRSISHQGGVTVFGGIWDQDEAGEIEGAGVFAIEGEAIVPVLVRGDGLDRVRVWRAWCRPQCNYGRSALLEVELRGQLTGEKRRGLYQVDW